MRPVVMLGLALLVGLFSTVEREAHGACHVWPGPKLISNSTQNVLVNQANGQLRLQITPAADRWICAEIFLPYSLGYGNYTWTIVSGASSVDPNVVFGLFTYDFDDPAQSHREIDVEFSKWSNPSDSMNAQFVLHPYDVPNHRQRFKAPVQYPLKVGFKWSPGQIQWQAASPTKILSTKDYFGADVPTPGQEVVHLNLWVYQATAGQCQILGPSNGKMARVVLQDFTFTPAT